MYGSTGTDVLSCARPKGHGGRHTSEPIAPTIFRLGWKVASSGRSTRTTPAPSTSNVHTPIPDEPVLTPLSNRDRWWNRLSLLGFLTGVALALGTAPLLLNGWLWLSALSYVVACLVLTVSLLSRKSATPSLFRSLVRSLSSRRVPVRPARAINRCEHGCCEPDPDRYDVTDTAAASVCVHHDPVAEWRRKSRRQVDEVTL